MLILVSKMPCSFARATTFEGKGAYLAGIGSLSKIAELASGSASQRTISK